MATYLERESEMTARRERQTRDVDVLDLLIVLSRGRRKIALVAIVALVIGTAVAFLLRATYTSTAVILPPTQQQSVQSAFLGQLGSLASLGSTNNLLKNPADMYVGILRSRTIADFVIEREHLASVYKTKTEVATRKKLDKYTKITAGKDNLIDIEVTDHDPNRAADIANAYLAGLYQVNSTLATSEAGQRRIFYDQQLNQEKDLLAAAEADLVTTQKKTGILTLTGQTEAVIRSTVQLQAQITQREVQLETLRSSSTSENPAIQRLETELGGLRAQLAKLEEEQKKSAGPGDILLPAGVVPAAGLEYIRKVRQVKLHEALYEILLKQDEIARLDEGKAAQVIQIVDRGMPADKRSGPSRVLIILGSLVFGLIVGGAWVWYAEILKRMKTHPDHGSRLESLRESLKNG
jgi:uncharacterized protein involved in exopolysaccharide biosynthesis